MIESDGYRKYPDGTCYKIPERPKNFKLNPSEANTANNLFGDKPGNNLSPSGEKASYEHSTHTTTTPCTQSTVHHHDKKSPDIIPRPTVNPSMGRDALERSRFGFDEYKPQDNNAIGRRSNYNRTGEIHLSMLLREFKGMELPQTHNYITTNKNGSMIPNLPTCRLGDVKLTKYEWKSNNITITNKDDKKKHFAEYDTKDENTIQIDNTSMRKSMKDDFVKNSLGKNLNIRNEKADSFQSDTYNASIRTYKPRKKADNGPTIPLKKIYENNSRSVSKKVDKRDIYQKPVIKISPEKKPVIKISPEKKPNSSPYNNTKNNNVQVTPNKNDSKKNLNQNTKPNISPVSQTKNDTKDPNQMYKPSGVPLYSMFNKKKDDSNKQDTLDVKNNRGNVQVKSNRDVTPARPNKNVPTTNSDRKINTNYNNRYNTPKKPENSPKKPDPSPKRPSPSPKRPDTTPKRPDPSPVRPSPSPQRPSTTQRRQTNNWVIQSFLPSQAEEQKIENLGTSISFVGETKKFDTLLRQLKKTNSKYTDDDFYHDFESLWGFGESRTHSKRAWQNDYKWARAGDIFSGEFKVYDNYIDPNDIIQGELGDCYFLSAISAISEFQNRIKKLFLTREVNDQCIYCIAMCINGVWEEVIIDDYFPVHRDKVGSKYDPCFNHSKSDLLWVIMLEKAWAKVHGGYLNINSGLTREALHDLTGAPSVTYFNDEGTDEERWKMILDAVKFGHILAAGTKDLHGDGRDTLEKKSGIVGSHAYSLLHAVELKKNGNNYTIVTDNDHPYKEKNIVRLIKLRNPWGKGEWKGAWSDKDSAWNENLRKNLNIKDIDDGMFYIPYENFLEYFEDFQICYCRDDYQYSSRRLETDKNSITYFTFEVKKQGNYYFSLNQSNKRFFPKDKGYTYSSCTQSLGRVETSKNLTKVTYMGAIQKADKEAWFKSSCLAGRYICAIYTPWKSFVNEITQASYGPETINFSRIPDSKVPKDFFQKLVQDKAIKSDKDWKDFAGQGQAKIRYKFEHSGDGFGYFSFENSSETTELKCEISFTTKKNVKALPPYTLDNPCQIIGPKSKESQIYFMIDTPSSVGFRMLTTFTKNANSQKTLVKGEGDKFIRKYKNRDVGICLYGLIHSEGVTWLYENESKNYQLEETVTYNLVNAYIEGSYRDTLKINLQPKQSKLVNIVFGHGSNSESGTMEESSFRINPIT